MSHSDLIVIARDWLRKQCSVVITELCTTGEVPDAIGWKGTHSFLVECKVSRADFIADRKKAWRFHDSMGIGTRRYFLAPSGIILQSELPIGWGLLELIGKQVMKVKDSEHFPEVNSRHEIGLLLSTLRRVGHDSPKNVSIKCYNFQTENTATVSIENECATH